MLTNSSIGNISVNEVGHDVSFYQFLLERGIMMSTESLFRRPVFFFSFFYGGFYRITVHLQDQL